MASAVTLKKNYRCFQSLKQFYSGGPFSVSSDGSFFVCSCDETVNIIDSSNAVVKSAIQGDSDVLTALILSPDDNFLFTASHSRQIRVYAVSSLECVRSWKGHEGPILGMACHASGGLLATAGADKKVQVWDVDGGFCTHYFKGHKGIVTCTMFHRDPLRLLLFSASDDSTVKVWDLTKKKCITTLEKHQSAVTSLTISEDGWTLITVGRDKVINLWNLHDYSCAKTIPAYEAMESVCTFSSSSQFASSLSSYVKEHSKKPISSFQFITVGERGILRAWNSDGSIVYEQKTSDLLASLETDEVKRGFTAATMLPLDQGLLCVTADQQFLIYDWEKDGNESLDLVLKKRLIGYNEEIVDMKFLGEEERFLAVATSVEQVRIYDLTSMSCSYVLTGHSDVVLCIDTCTTNSQRTLIVTGSKDNTVRLWDSKEGRCIGVGIGHMGAVGAIAFSMKNKNFFVSGSSDRTLKVWSLDGLSDCADDDSVFNLKTKAIVAAHDKDINSLAVAPNDSLVCSGSQDRTACIWRLPDLVSVVVLRGHKRGIWSVEFSPVDQCVITASGDKTVKIWAISDGSCLKTFEGHNSSVYRASFVTRGAQFVSCGADGLVKLWTVKSDECIATYDHHDEKIWALAVGKQTEMLATGGGDASITLWRDSTSAEKQEAFEKEEEGALRGQELDIAVFDGDYTRAVRLAFELRRPHKLFELFNQISRNPDGIEKALPHFGNDDELRQLLGYIREWNTKPKMCHVAQRVLQRVLRLIPPTRIVEMKGIGELVEGLIPYSERHFGRIQRLERSTFLFDFTLARMAVIEPRAEEDDAKISKRKSEASSEKRMEKKRKAAAYVSVECVS